MAKAINFIFTNCQGACPLMTKNLTFVRDMLGGEVGKSVHFVSISIDPTRDTPAAMKEFAQTHDADHAGWTWITGKKSEIDQVLLGLRAYSPDLDEHPSMILIGDGRVGGWTRYYGFPKIDTLMNQIHALRDQKNALSSSRPGGN